MKQRFKSIAALLLCVALVFGILCQIPGTKMTTNAATSSNQPVNLLSGSNTNNTIPNWTIESGVTQSKDQVKTGTWALKVENGTGYAISEPVAVVAGAHYAATAQVFGTVAADLKITYFDANGNELAGAAAVKSSTPAAGWQELSVAAQAPANAATVAVKVSSAAATASAPVYFDDVSVKRVATSFTPVVTNGDFSDDLTGWTVTSGKCEVEDGALKAQYFGGRKATFNTEFTVESGIAYRFAIDVKAPADCQLYTRVYFYNAEGTEVAPTVAANWTNLNQLAIKGTNTDFETVSVSTVAPASAVKAKIELYNHLTGVMYFDNARVEVLAGSVSFGQENANLYYTWNASPKAMTEGYWIDSRRTGGGYTSVIDTTAPYSGTQSLTISQNTFIFSPMISVVPGATYTFSYMAKGAPVLAASFGYKADGTSVAPTVVKDTTTSAAEWTKITHTLTPAADTAYTLMLLGAGAGGCSYDNFTITESNNPELLVNNAGFEINPNVPAKIGDTPYASIEEALAAAQAGDTIILMPGTHGVIDLDGYGALENLTIKGEDKATVFVDGIGWNGAAVNSSPAGLTIKDMTITGETVIQNNAGIGGYYLNDGLTVENCIFNGDAMIFTLSASAARPVSNLTVKNCTFNGPVSANKSAILLRAISGNTKITGNTFNNVYWDAIQATVSVDGNVTITGNNFASAGAGYINFYGLKDSYSGVLVITDNTFTPIANLNDATGGYYVWLGTNTALVNTGVNQYTMEQGKTSDFYFRGIQFSTNVPSSSSTAASSSSTVASSSSTVASSSTAAGSTGTTAAGTTSAAGTTGATSATSGKTGDTTNVMGMTAIMALALTALAALVVGKKKFF